MYICVCTHIYTHLHTHIHSYVHLYVYLEHIVVDVHLLDIH